MTAKAEVQVDVKGEAEAQRALKKLNDGFKSFGRELGGIFAGAIREFAGASVALARVDPMAAADKFRTYRQTVTEWSIASKRSIADVKSSFSGLADATLLPDDQVADFSRSLGKATYDAHDSRAAIEALRGSGLAAGRSLEEMAPIAETLHNSFGASFGDIPGMLGDIEGAANALGTAGGPAALQDSIVNLGGAISQVSVKGKAEAKELIDVLAAISAHARTPEQAKDVQSKLVNRFLAGGEQMRLNLGIKRKDFYDETGQIKVNAENVTKLRDFYIKRAGSVEGARSLASFSNNLGPQLAAALFSPDFVANLKKAESAAPGKGGAQALQDLAKSQAGVEGGAQIRRDRETRENLGSKINATQQAVANAAPENSLLRYATGGIVGGAASALLGRGASALGEKAMGSLAASMFSVAVSGNKAAVALNAFGGVSQLGVKSLSAFAGKLGLLGAVGVGAYEGAKYLDNRYNISGKLANALDYKSAAKEEGGVAANKFVLAAKEENKQKAIKAYEAQGYSHGEAVNYAEHPDRAPMGPQNKPAPVEVKLQILDDSSHPNRVVEVGKGQAGQQ